MEIIFDQVNVAEITGVSVVAAGNVNATISSAYAVNQEFNRESGQLHQILGEFSLTGGMEIVKVPRRMNVDPAGSVKRLTLSFVTGSSTENINAGTDGPVAMTLGYYNTNGDLVSRQYSDIRTFMKNNAPGFPANSTEQITLLVPAFQELRWVELVPRRQEDASDTPATWNLKELSAAVGEAGSVYTRGVDWLILESQPAHIPMVDILLSGKIHVHSSGTETHETTLPETGSDGTAEISISTGQTQNLLLESGQSVEITMELTGSTEGLRVALNSYHPVAGAEGVANLADTRGYTQELFNRNAQEARIKIQAANEAAAEAKTPAALRDAARSRTAAEMELAIWESAKPAPGSLTPSPFQLYSRSLLFTPPRNYTGSELMYQILVQSAESAAAQFIVRITVRPEENPVQQQLDTLDRWKQDAAAQEVIDSQREAAEQMQQLEEEMRRREARGEDSTDSGSDSGSAPMAGVETGGTEDNTPTPSEESGSSPENGGSSPAEGDSGE